MILSTIARNLIQLLQYESFGRQNLIYDPKSIQSIPGQEFKIFSGFRTGIQHLEGGVFLQARLFKKLVHNETVLQFAGKIRNKHPKNYRIVLDQQLLNRLVVTDYGQNEVWQIL